MLTILIALGIFGTILLFMHGCVLLRRTMTPRGTDRAIERIQNWSAPVTGAPSGILRQDRASEIPWLNDFLRHARRVEPFRVLHRQAGCQTPLGVFVLATPLLVLTGLLTLSGMQVPFLLVVIGGIACGILPGGYLYWLKRQRLRKFEHQLPDALELISRALRAGHAFSVGLNLVGEEAVEPVRGEFKRVFDEISMGVAVQQALQSMTERIDSVDLRLFVTSVLVQRETGGNLAEIIDSLAGLIRKRFELHLKVSALSAEGRFSAVVLFCLPLVVGGVLFKLNSEYMMTLFTDPVGRNMVIVGSLLMIIGAAVMKRMVAIRV